MRTHIFSLLLALIFTSCASFHGREPASVKNSQQEHEVSTTGADSAIGVRDFGANADK